MTRPMIQPSAFAITRNRAAVMEELRRLLPGGIEGLRTTLPFGIAPLDACLPEGGLACGALHEVVPETAGCIAAAFGFIAAILAGIGANFPPQRGREPVVFVVPAYGLRHYGRLHGHGLNGLGLDPARLILVETAHRKETLWALEEALRSAAPAAVAGVIDTLDLKTSQRLHLAATDAGLPLLLLRAPSPACAAGWRGGSAAATRWCVGTAAAARDRFGLIARPRWHLKLERCRNGRPGEWVVEYDHVAHRFSLAAALADPALARGAGDQSHRQAC